MKKNILRITGVLLVIAMMVSVFAGCTGGTVTGPEKGQIKTDLKDATFTFTYGDLKTVLPPDQLASLFENTNKKTDEKTIDLSYYELVSKYGYQDYFDSIIKLIPAAELAKLTANQQEVLDYFNTLINDIKATGAPKVSYSEGFWINHGDGVVFKSADGTELEGQSELRAAFRLYADMALKDIGSFLMNKGQDEALDHGSDLTDVLYVWGSDKASTLTLSDLYSEDKTYPVYSSVVPTLEYQLDKKGNNAKDEDGEYIFVPTDYFRTIIITVKPEEESVKKAFSIREKNGILEQFKVAENYMTVNSFEIGFNPCKITAGIDAETDQMTYVTYEKNMIITADVTFTGALEKYGNVIVEFPCTSSLTYDFGWPSEAE